MRLMDLNPFLDVGIDLDTIRFLDVFLLHALLSDSPPDSLEEIEALGRNQQLVAARGREPGLRLERNGTEVVLTEWAQQLLDEMQPLAQQLDAQLGGSSHAQALAAAQASLDDPARLPSARVLARTLETADQTFVAFVRERSAEVRARMLAQAPSAEERAEFARLATESVTQQQAIEAADTMPFEEYRQFYVSPERLGAAIGR